MTTTTTWSVTAMDCYPQEGENTNVVFTIHWNCSATDGLPFAEQIKGNYFKPGDDYSAEEAKVQSVCALVHTAEVIAAYQAEQQAAQQALTPG